MGRLSFEIDDLVESHDVGEAERLMALSMALGRMLGRIGVGMQNLDQVLGLMMDGYRESLNEDCLEAKRMRCLRILEEAGVSR
jgi:hypothetical protein